MMVIGDDLDGVVYFESKNIYIMDDHSWAFLAWEFERLKGTIKNNSCLLHFDRHLDDVPDRVHINGLLEANNKEQLISLIATKKERHGSNYNDKISIDNFIWPSFARGTLGSMYTISPQKQETYAEWLLKDGQHEYQREEDEIHKENFLKYIPIEKVENVMRIYSFDEFDIQGFINFSGDASKILNIDLDYFNLSDNFLEPKLMADEKVRNILSKLIYCCDWDVITVAISPICIWQ